MLSDHFLAAISEGLKAFAISNRFFSYFDREEFLDKLERTIKGGKMDIKKFFRKHSKNVKRFIKNSKKKRPQVTTACQDFS